MITELRPYFPLVTTLLIKSLGIFFGLIFSFNLANHLDPINFSSYSLIISLSITISSFLNLGLDFTINENVAKFNKITKETKDALISLFALICILSVITLTTAFFMFHNYFITIAILQLLIITIWFNNTQVAFLNALRFIIFSQFSLVFLKNFLLLTLSIFLIYLLVDKTFSSNDFLVMYLIVIFILIVVNFLYIHYEVKKNFFTGGIFNFVSIANLLKKNFLICGVMAYIFVESQIPLYFLKVLDLDFEAGIFSFSLLFFYVFNLPLTIANSFLMPRISQLFNQKKYCDIQKLINLTSKFSFLSVLTAFILLLIFLDIFLIHFFSSYKLAYYPIFLICLTQVINTYFGPTALMLILSKNLTNLLKIFFISFLLFIFSLAILFYFEINKLIIVTSSLLISVFSWNLICYLFILKNYKIRTKFCLN